MSYYFLILIFAAIFSFYLAIRNEKKFQRKLNELDGFRDEINNISAKLDELNSRNSKSAKLVFMINQNIAFNEERRSFNQLQTNDIASLEASTERCFAFFESTV